MGYVFSKKYVPPTHLTLSQKVEYSIKLVEKHRTEAKVLRKITALSQTAQRRAEKETELWKGRFKKSQEELKKAKEEIGKLRKEKGKLEQEIDRLTKTNSRYKISLFDHGNFKHKEDSQKKARGGQLNHPDTNREGQMNFLGYESFERKRFYAKNCGQCGSNLKRVNATKEKALLDIVIKPEVIQMILEAERQWCSSCKKEVNAKDPQSLPFSEYGLNSFMMVMILRHKAHCSLSTTAKVIEIGFGLKLSSSDVSNLLKTGAGYLKDKYNQLKQAIRDGQVMYVDETGWLVRGQKAWMWIMASENKLDSEGNILEPGVTVYVAAESRGKGIAREIYGNSCSLCMSDGLYSYLNTIPREKHCYCWAHVLRFSFEETINSREDSMAVFLREELVRIYHLKFEHCEYSKETLEQVLTDGLDKLLSLRSEEESFLNIQNRVSGQRYGLIKSLIETESGTNNLAERELRPLVLNRKISFGSDTYTGMETTAIVASIIQTLGRQGKDCLIELTLNLQIGIHQKYPQYQHLAYSDSS